MNPLLFSPVLLAISLSTTAMFSTAQLAVPSESSAVPEASDPRVLLNEQFARLEALRAQLQAAQRDAELARQPATVAAPTSPASTRPVAPTGPRATLLATVRLQPASGLDSAARGLTPESAWRIAFPRKNGR